MSVLHIAVTNKVKAAARAESRLDVHYRAFLGMFQISVYILHATSENTLEVAWDERPAYAVTNKATAVAEAESCLYVGITHKTQTTEFIND